jgi:hypothetical protein
VNAVPLTLLRFAHRRTSVTACNFPKFHELAPEGFRKSDTQARGLHAAAEGLQEFVHRTTDDQKDR